MDQEVIKAIVDCRTPLQMGRLELYRQRLDQVGVLIQKSPEIRPLYELMEAEYAIDARQAFDQSRKRLKAAELLAREFESSGNLVGMIYITWARLAHNQRRLARALFLSKRAVEMASPNSRVGSGAAAAISFFSSLRGNFEEALRWGRIASERALKVPEFDKHRARGYALQAVGTIDAEQGLMTEEAVNTLLDAAAEYEAAVLPRDAASAYQTIVKGALAGHSQDLKTLSVSCLVASEILLGDFQRGLSQCPFPG